MPPAEPSRAVHRIDPNVRYGGRVYFVYRRPRVLLYRPRVSRAGAYRPIALPPRGFGEAALVGAPTSGEPTAQWRNKDDPWPSFVPGGASGAATCSRARVLTAGENRSSDACSTDASRFTVCSSSPFNDAGLQLHARTHGSRVTVCYGT
jgi:hypothetical protein